MAVIALAVIALWWSEREGASPKPQPGLVVAWEDRPRTFDPRYAVDANSQYIENLLHCSLVDFDSDGRVVARLARNWQWTSPLTLQVDLRTDARFGDGSAVTAADVAANYRFYGQPATPPSPRAGAFAKVAKVDILAPDRLQFVLAEPDSTFLTNLVVGILPEKRAAGTIIDDDEEVVGCGPYRLTAAEPGQLVLSANAQYSLGPAPKTSVIAIKFVGDETTRFAKLRRGEVDIVQNGISFETLDRIEDYPELKVAKRPGLRTTYVGFNFRDPVLKNRAVREAISLAVDREALITHLLHGYAVPAATLLPPESPYFSDAMKAPVLDRERAKRLLDRAGFKPDENGVRLRLTYKTTTQRRRIAIGKGVAGDLRKIGIELKVMPLEWGRFKADVDKGKVQLWGLTWIGFKDPDIFRYVFAAESVPPNGGNRGWFDHAELNELVAKARVATAFETRRRLYDRVQQLVAREHPYVFLFHEENYAVMGAKVQGFRLYADGRYAALPETTRL